MADQQLHRVIVEHQEKVQLLRRERVRVKIAEWPQNIVFKGVQQEDLSQFAVFPKSDAKDFV
jgi:hypothetical protein